MKNGEKTIENQKEEYIIYKSAGCFPIDAIACAVFVLIGIIDPSFEDIMAAIFFGGCLIVFIIVHRNYLKENRKAILTEETICFISDRGRYSTTIGWDEILNIKKYEAGYRPRIITLSVIDEDGNQKYIEDRIQHGKNINGQKEKTIGMGLNECEDDPDKIFQKVIEYWESYKRKQKEQSAKKLMKEYLETHNVSITNEGTLDSIVYDMTSVILKDEAEKIQDEK